jgi:cytidyltransferase-like protein
MRKFSNVAVGGTFDQLHKGHITLLAKAFELGEHVTIGLCSDSFVAKMGKPHVTAPYEERLRDLTSFLKTRGLAGRFEIVELNDAYGTAVSDGSIEALIVSDETKDTALAINVKRVSANLPSLEIASIRMVPAENCSPISTTKIRSGEIDREGRLLKRQRVDGF